MDSWANKFKSLFNSLNPILLIRSIVVPANKKLVVTTDSLLEGVHFPLATPAHAIGFKSLAVNLSDLAAMGASPHACNMVLGLPEYNDQWVQQFVQGWAELALQFSVPIGEIKTFRTAQEIEIHVTAFGLLSEGEGLYRHTAQMGDLIYVSGTLGEAAVGLSLELQLIDNENPLKALDDITLIALGKHEQYLVSRLRYPTARVELGRVLNGVASSCLDISDGLQADLGHIVQRSQVAAQINCGDLFISEALTQHSLQVSADTNSDKLSSNKLSRAWDDMLTGGDDYELCFTVAPSNKQFIEQISDECNIRLSCIGEMTEGYCVTKTLSTNDEVQRSQDDIQGRDADKNLTVLDAQGALYFPQTKSYEHFQ